MHFTCAQKELSHALGLVSQATGGVLPILSTILVTAIDTPDDQAVYVSGTNLNIAIRVRIEASPTLVIKEQGQAAIPAKLFADLVATLPPGEVEIEQVVKGEGEGAVYTNKVRGGSSKSEIRGLDPTLFPDIAPAQDMRQCVIEAAVLRGMIREVAFAAAKDESRPVFQAVIFRQKGEELHAAAADSFRLARSIAGGFTDTPFKDAPVLIPASSLKELEKVLPAEGNVIISVGAMGNVCLFQSEDHSVMLSTRLISGNYPDFEHMFTSGEKGVTTEVILNTREVQQGVKTASLFADAGQKAVTLTLEAVDTASLDGTVPICIEATSADVGAGQRIVYGRANGLPFKVMVNVAFFADMLSALDTPTFSLRLQGHNKPLLVSPIDAKRSVAHLVMPMTNTPRKEEEAVVAAA